MNTQKLPIGIDNFEKLRRENFYYVDKSLLIKDLLCNWSEVNLFTRPRRFGKTLNMSMLKSFFEAGGDPSLFDGLAIAEEKALCSQHMGKYPVVFVSLKGVDGLTFDEARRRLADIIQREARRLSFLLDSPALKEFDKKTLNEMIYLQGESPALRTTLTDLTQLMEKHYGRKTILLIDEYDVPLDKAYQHGYYNEMIDLIRSMFGQALKTNDSLFFAVLTGCLRVSKESIFTGLNNLKVNGIADVQFDESFGFTEEEVAALFRHYGLQDHLIEAKEWYDGYRFGTQDVYCPWDVINYCSDIRTDSEAQPQAYWINTSGNDMVRRLVDKAGTATEKDEIEKLIAGEPIRKTLNDRLTHNETDKDINNVWSLLFMTGYLTVKSKPFNGVYDLVIPNKEVRKIYIEQILSWFKDKTRAETKELSALYSAFAEGDETEVTEQLNRQLMETISYFDAYESFYHGFLLALLSACAVWRVTSNAEAGRGRSDIVVESVDRKLGMVIEIKEVKNSDDLEPACEAALAQIKDRYYTALLRKYRYEHILTYGIAFSGKQCKAMAQHLDSVKS